MSKLVTIYGGSGFVGRYIARRMAKAGWRVRVAVRRPNEAMFVKTYGSVGQVEPVFCNIRDDASVASVMTGADAVVNCVGTFDARGRNSFENIHVEGAGRIARIAAAQGVGTMVHISALGADIDGESQYAQSKARGEEAVTEHMPQAVILRPSVIFGPEDQFFNRFAGMARLGPILPVVGGDTKFQPVYVDNVAEAAEMAVTGKAAPGVYELGGPDVQTFTEWMHEMLAVIHRRRLVLNMPFFVGNLMAFGFTVMQYATLGLVKNKVITFDQVKSLRTDNVVSEGARTLADLGITPTATEAVLPDYLWRFRPSGQYDEIMESAKNLRG
ncbi:complex I NDUFA9 subunit family protein [Pseudaestuariivita atlantica]|uniref:3-beta hydroxysteroid dehydrogenase n=1 Tax=Pseudaestuariivita atlantica TaxID=1317121 RepID=A0A0L1JQ95_9RHOB|nr:complex I NDUFA9 subunit family protein [Pseudaestuariivita atlantica]KNG93897.1 3-beta hydroxysteroid dehydrogenase [Pseudaestuariivita atlantica]